MINVRASRELQAAVLGLKAMDRSLATDIRRATVSTIGPVWTSAVQARARSTRDQRILATGAKVKGGNPPQAIAGASARRMKGGGRPQDLARGQEFGSVNRRRKRTYPTHSPKGTSYTVTRRTQAQLPARQNSGRVVYPAVADVGPRLVSLWVQLIVRKVYQGLGD